MSTTKTKDKAAWGAAKRHTVTLPSGYEVDIEIPNLPQMVKAGQIPNDLLDAALGAVGKVPDVTPELIKEQADFYYLLVSKTVVDPVVSVEDLEGGAIPYEDIELLVELATRQRDVDALGRHIGGLHKSAEWRRFRGLDSLD